MHDVLGTLLRPIFESHNTVHVCVTIESKVKGPTGRYHYRDVVQ